MCLQNDYLNLNYFSFKRLIVTFSIERTMAIYFPLKHKARNTKKEIKKYVKAILLIGVVYNLINILIIGVDHQSNSLMKKCAIINNWLYLAEFVIPIDLVLNTVIPILTISILNTLIALKLSYFSSDIKQSELKSFNQETKTINVNLKKSETIYSTCKAISNGSSLKISPTNEKQYLSVHNSLSFKNEKNLLKPVEKHFHKSEPSLSDSIHSAISWTNIESRKKKYSKASRVLFLISITFLVLRFPMCISKIYFIINMTNEETSLTRSSHQMNSTIFVTVKSNYSANTQVINSMSSNYEFDFSLTQKFLFNLSNKLYYLNFGLNFFLYSFDRSK